MKTIIIGATSGIGKALAIELVKRGETVGLVGRRNERLKELKTELGEKAYIKAFDIAEVETSMAKLNELIEEMQGMDRIVLNAGTSAISTDVSWEEEKKVIEVNIFGLTALANVSFKYFCKEGKGHIIGISSIAALRGGPMTRTYQASKAYLSNYLEGLSFNGIILGKNIDVTNIMPGYVDTEMTEHDVTQKNWFWVASAEKAAKQIADAIMAKKLTVYVSRRWRLMAWIYKMLPEQYMKSKSLLLLLRIFQFLGRKNR